MPALGSAPANTPPAVGFGLGGLAYYAPQLPFMNVIKGSVSNQAQAGAGGWQTFVSTDFATATYEEGYLQLDSNGYPTSLVANPTPPGGQLFTMVAIFFQVNAGLPPGANYYKGGNYRVTFDGAGTLQLQGDGHGTQISTSGTVINLTPGPGGVPIFLIATDPLGTGNYLRNLAMVHVSNTAAYDAGAIFTPEFLAATANMKAFRFMDWQNTVGEFGSRLSQTYGQIDIPAGATSAVMGTTFTLTTTLAQGATSAVLSRMDGGWLGGAAAWNPLPKSTIELTFSNGDRRNITISSVSNNLSWTGGLSSAVTTQVYAQVVWPNRSGKYNTVFNTGEQRMVNYVAGSPILTWDQPLTQAAKWSTSGQYGGQVAVSQRSWAGRSLPSHVSWATTLGAPWETCFALCQAQNCDAYINVPVGYTDSDVTNLAQLALNSLSNGLHVEFSNEAWWEPGIFDTLGYLGAFMWPNAGGSHNDYNRNFYGMRCAQIADIFQNVWGSQFGRCSPIISGQTAVTGNGLQAIATAFWTQGPAYNHALKEFAVTFYYGTGISSAADCATLVGQADGGLTDFFATLYSNIAPGGTYSSCPAGGGFSTAIGWIQSYQSALAAQYPKLKLVVYEGGFGSVPNQPPGNPGGATATAWAAMLDQTTEDPRIYTSTQYVLQQWVNLVGRDRLFNYFVDTALDSSFGNWGALEGTLQTLSPISAAPLKWRAIKNFMGYTV